MEEKLYDSNKLLREEIQSAERERDDNLTSKVDVTETEAENLCKDLKQSAPDLSLHRQAPYPYTTAFTNDFFTIPRTYIVIAYRWRG